VAARQATVCPPTGPAFCGHATRRRAIKTIQGPAIFLAQFAADTPPYHSLAGLARWAAGHGYTGVQVPSGDPRLFDLRTAAESQTYCDEVTGLLADHGLTLTELSCHAQGALVAAHPAYDPLLDSFAPACVRGDPQARQVWAVEQLHLAARAAANLGLRNCGAFTGGLAWPFVYPFPERPDGLIDAAFDELARRWRPILDAFDAAGCNLCFEPHPCQDVFDGVTFEMFLERLGGHRRANILYDPSHFVLQQLDYLGFIDVYRDRIRMFHVKDAEFAPSARQGVYSGYQPWVNRAGRFRSAGDGQVDFQAIFSKLSAEDFDGWAVLEWECCLKHPEDGAREGAAFIADHIINVAERPAGTAPAGDRATNRRLLGLDR
jgi:sugar phosphate isomerase/epimerase